jgi:hypothetical protein
VSARLPFFCDPDEAREHAQRCRAHARNERRRRELVAEVELADMVVQALRVKASGVPFTEAFARHGRALDALKAFDQAVNRRDYDPLDEYDLASAA